MATGPEEALYGRWMHSHEEDTADEMVFRPGTHRFPPARGRRSLELRADGTYVESSPGPVDLPVESTGRWSLDGDRLVLGGEGQRSHALQVVATDGDRLVIKRTPPTPG